MCLGLEGSLCSVWLLRRLCPCFGGNLCWPWWFFLGSWICWLQASSCSWVDASPCSPPSIHPSWCSCVRGGIGQSSTLNLMAGVSCQPYSRLDIKVVAQTRDPTLCRPLAHWPIFSGANSHRWVRRTSQIEFVRSAAPWCTQAPWVSCFGMCRAVKGSLGST